MTLLLIVLAFLAPVVLVFGYSIWLQRRRRTSETTETDSEKENKNS
jgi:hypothetical protein